MGGSQRRLPATGQLVFFFGGVDSAVALVLAGGLTPLCFFFGGRSVGGKKGKSVSQRCLPAIGRLVCFFFFLGGGVVDSALAFVLVGGLTPFFLSVIIPLLIGTGNFFGFFFFFWGGVGWDGK